MREYRDYFRPDERRSSLWVGLSSVTQALILVDVGIFLIFASWAYVVRPLALGLVDPPPDAYAERVFGVVGLSPLSAIGAGKVWQLFTYAFLHDTARPFHLLFNMLTLFFFGREVETLYGPRRFLALYFSAAAFTGLLYCLAYDAPRLLGASGAVYAVMAAYACHYPRQRILFFFLLPIEVWLVVTILISLDVGLFVAGEGGHAAHLALLGGAGFGWLFHGLEPRIGRYLHRFERRVKRSDVAHDEEIEARLDTLLEKISRDGIGSLSKKEREFLKRASLHYQNKA